jgi:hypothetical protein
MMEGFGDSLSDAATAIGEEFDRGPFGIGTRFIGGTADDAWQSFNLRSNGETLLGGATGGAAGGIEEKADNTSTIKGNGIVGLGIIAGAAGGDIAGAASVRGGIAPREFRHYAESIGLGGWYASRPEFLFWEWVLGP